LIDPGTLDIKGIDAPPRSKITIPQGKPRKLSHKIRTSGSKPANNFPSKKVGHQYYTKLGKTTAVSRHRIGSRKRR